MKKVKTEMEKSVKFEIDGLDKWKKYTTQEPHTTQEQADRRCAEQSIRVRTITKYVDVLKVIERHFPELKRLN